MIHGDLCPENILVHFDKDNKVLEDIRIIDFGSSLHFYELDKLTEVTSEYLPPEILEFMDRPNFSPGGCCTLNEGKNCQHI